MMNDIYEEDLVELTEEELEEVAGGKKKSVYVKVREANIRSGPGTEYSIVWGMGKGDELEPVHTNASTIMANKMKPAKTMSSLS